MRKFTIILFLILSIISQVCFASSYELVYRDSIGGQLYLDKDSVKPMKYRLWDCYKASTKLEFGKPMDNITYSVLCYLVNKENKNYALVYIENYDANNTLLSFEDRSNKLNWFPYDEKNDNHLLVDKVLEIVKEGK